MEMKITQDTKNEVLNRREIVAEIEEKIIPSRDEVRKKLAAVAGVKESTLIIEKIDSNFGNPVQTIKANAYTDEESMKTNEQEYLLKRNIKEAPKEEEKTEEAPAAETAPAENAEATPEAKTEEAPKAEEPATTDPAPADETATEKKKEGEQ